jgi:hypothetical protein
VKLYFLRSTARAIQRAEGTHTPNTIVITAIPAVTCIPVEVINTVIVIAANTSADATNNP